MARQNGQRNKVDLDGQLTRDVEIRGTENKVAIISLACNRYIGDNAPENVQTADFLPLKMFGKNIDWLKNYKKGQAVTISGRLESGSYTNQDGQKVYETYVNVTYIQPLERRSRENSDNGSGDSFIQIPDDMENQMPFK